MKKKADLVQAKKLFEASMVGDLNLLKQMKFIRGWNVDHGELPETVAGGNSEEEIVEKFHEVYSNLYNSAESEKDMEKLMSKVLTLLKNDSDTVGEVGRITAVKVKDAVVQLKPKKADTLLQAPDILFEHLASIFRSWLFHGTDTMSLLACAFLPLLKSSLKDPKDTGSWIMYDTKTV